MLNEPIAPKPARPSAGKNYFVGRSEKINKGNVVIPSKPPEPPKMPMAPKVAGDFSKWAKESGILKEAVGLGTSLKVLAGGAGLAGAAYIGANIASGRRRAKASSKLTSHMRNKSVNDMLGTGPSNITTAMNKYRTEAYGK